MITRDTDRRSFFPWHHNKLPASSEYKSITRAAKHVSQTGALGRGAGALK